jgi:hypothetical protein
MAETFTKADVERLVADALKLQSAKHDEALEQLKTAAAKTESQKAHEGAMTAHRSKQASIRATALEAQGAGVRVLKYVVGPSGAYSNGQILKPGDIAEKPNLSEVTDPGAGATAEQAEAYATYLRSLPSIEWEAVDKRAPKADATPEKRGALTAAEMNKLDAERPKHGVQAAKKGSRPSDTEV